jgi:hypothetical protein
MFWFDISERTYSRGTIWRGPDTTLSLRQKIDENEVAAILWPLSDGGAQPIYTALASDRMRRPPFGRCYVRHSFELDRGTGTYRDVCAYPSQPAPILADELDALNCAGISRTRIRDAVGSYPYPVDAPWCSAGARPMTCPPSAYPSCDARAPLVVRWVPRQEPVTFGSGTRLVLVARVEQPGYLGLPLSVSVRVPSGVVLTHGSLSYAVRPGPPGTVHEQEFVFELTGSAPSEDLLLVADAQGTAAGFHAEIPYRFGRAEPAFQLRMTGTPLMFDHTSLGPSIDMGPITNGLQ